MSVPEHLLTSPNSRGFLRLPAIEGHYGGQIDLHESSGETAALWVDFSQANDANDWLRAKLSGKSYLGEYTHGTVLLLKEDCVKLAEQLLLLAAES